MARNSALTIFDLLKQGVPVWSDEDREVIVVWNESKTFNIWHTEGDGFYNIDCFTSDAASLDEAKDIAERHMMPSDESEAA